MEIREREENVLKEQSRRDLEKEFKLQNEYRRLKSEDIRKLRERQKRIDQHKKLQLI
jgi:hypothetical protein